MPSKPQLTRESNCQASFVLRITPPLSARRAAPMFPHAWHRSTEIVLPSLESKSPVQSVLTRQLNRRNLVTNFDLYSDAGCFEKIGLANSIPQSGLTQFLPAS